MGDRLSDLSGRALFRAVRKAAGAIATARRSRLYASALLRGHAPDESTALKLYADKLITYREYRSAGDRDLLHRERGLCVTNAWRYIWFRTTQRVAPYLAPRHLDAALCILEEPIPAPLAIFTSAILRSTANVIYADEDWEGMPIFADMLDDAGLPIHAAHCRWHSFHARGCWVLESLRCG